MKAVRSTAAALLVLLAATACSATPADRPEPAPQTRTRLPTPVQPEAVSTPAGAVSVTPSDAAPGATDAAWLQLMTPMNEGAVELLTMAGDRSTDPDLRTFAKDLATGHRTELGRLRPLMKKMGLPDTNVHEGHEMPGMVTPGDLAQARGAEGAAFEKIFVVQIREHLEQGARLSRSEIDAGSEAAAKRYAATLLKARQDSLDSLDGPMS